METVFIVNLKNSRPRILTHLAQTLFCVKEKMMGSNFGSLLDIMSVPDRLQVPLRLETFNYFVCQLLHCLNPEQNLELFFVVPNSAMTANF